MVKKKSAKVDFTKYKTDLNKTFLDNLWLSFVAKILLKILLLASVHCRSLLLFIAISTIHRVSELKGNLSEKFRCSNYFR